MTRFATKLESEVGSHRSSGGTWWADATSAAIDVARLHERLATPAMFGGGTLAVVANAGVLVKRNDTRDLVVETIGLMAPGHGLAVVEAAKSNAKGPGIRRLADPIRLPAGRSPRRWLLGRRPSRHGSPTRRAIVASSSPVERHGSWPTDSGRE